MPVLPGVARGALLSLGPRVGVAPALVGLALALAEHGEHGVVRHGGSSIVGVDGVVDRGDHALDALGPLLQQLALLAQRGAAVEVGGSPTGPSMSVAISIGAITQWVATRCGSPGR